MFKSIGHYQYSKVDTSLPTRSGEGAAATPLGDSIVSIKNVSEKMERHQLPVKCLIELSNNYRVSSYSNLTNLDYEPSGNEWNCEYEMGELNTRDSASWYYKNATIRVNSYHGLPRFTAVNIHPPVPLTQEFKTLKDIFDFVKKREDAPQPGFG